MAQGLLARSLTPKAELVDLEEEGAAHAQPLVDVEAPVQVRVVDQPCRGHTTTTR